MSADVGILFLASRGFPGAFSGLSRGFPWAFPGLSRGFPRVSRGFPGFPGAFPRLSRGYPGSSPRFSRVSQGFPGACPMLSRGFPGACPACPFCSYRCVWQFLFCVVRSRNIRDRRVKKKNSNKNTFCQIWLAELGRRQFDAVSRDQDDGDHERATECPKHQK